MFLFSSFTLTKFLTYKLCPLFIHFKEQNPPPPQNKKKVKKYSEFRTMFVLKAKIAKKGEKLCRNLR